MYGSDMLDRLVQHQDRIVAIIATAEPMLIDPARRDIPALASTRWTLARTLIAYQLFKHHHIFNPAIAARLVGGADRAARMKAACIEMGDAFRAHVARWSSTDIAGVWPVYQPAAVAMVARLRQHIARERREIGWLLDQAA